MKNTLLFGYQLDQKGFIQKFAIALDRMIISSGKQMFEFENEKVVQLFAYDSQKEHLVKDFEIKCNERNALGLPSNWPPADLKFDDQGKRLVIVNKQATQLSVFSTVKLDPDIQSDPLFRFFRGQQAVKMSMPLQIVTISSFAQGGGQLFRTLKRQLSRERLTTPADSMHPSEETLTVAIMCNMAGTIHVFRLPTAVEMWRQIQFLQKDL